MNTQTLLGRADNSSALNGRADNAIALSGRFQPLPGVTDSFTDDDGVLLENHTPDVGSAWEKIYGPAADIQSNEVVPAVSVFSGWYVQQVLPASGHAMTMTVKTHAGGQIGFICHRQSGLILYYGYVTLTTYAIAIINPGIVILVSLIEAPPARPFTLELRVRYGDDSLRLLANGVEKVSTDNADLLGGQSGMALGGFGGGGVVDDFRLIERHGKRASVSGRNDAAKALKGRSDTAITLLGRS